ncbi:MAG: type II toxin-antitoxin system Phd/YefM family antitoxin [Solirubrobacteraceae bacterium]
MANISIQELRNHSRDVIGRADRGERITITRYGKPVAELRPALKKQGFAVQQVVA